MAETKKSPMVRENRTNYRKDLVRLIYPSVGRVRKVRVFPEQARYLLVAPMIVMIFAFLIPIPMLLIHKNEWSFWVGMAISVIFFIVLFRNSTLFLSSSKQQNPGVRLTNAYITSFFGPFCFSCFFLILRRFSDYLEDGYVFFILIAGFCLNVILFSVSVAGRMHYRIPFIISIVILSVLIVLYSQRFQTDEKTVSVLVDGWKSFLSDYVFCYLSLLL